MKRYISLALAVVVLIISLAIPSYASEPVIMDILEYSSLNEDGTNSFNAVDSGWYGFPNVTGNFRYIDLVIRFSLPQESIPITFYPAHFGIRFDPIKIDDYTYRWVGTIDPTFPISTLEFQLSGSVNDCVAEVLSCRVSSKDISSYDCPVSGYISYAGGEEVSFYYNNWDDYSGANIYGSDDFNYDDFTSYLFIDDWKKYDFIDLEVYLNELSFYSLTVSLDGLSVPYTVSFINSQSSFDIVAANIILDLTSVRRDIDGTLEVIITGGVPGINGRIGRFTVLHSFGLVNDSILNSNSIFWYRIKTFFTNQFSSLSTWISDQTSVISGKFDVLGEWLRVYFSNLGSTVSTEAQNIISSVSGNFASLGEWMRHYFGSLETTISGHFASLGEWLRAYFTNLDNTISSWGQSIVDAINGDASDADEFKQQIDDSNKELNDMAAVMDSFTTPDINSINVDVGSFVSPTDITSLTVPMGMLFESDLVVTCIMISIILSTVMFVLYGKR